MSLESWDPDAKLSAADNGPSPAMVSKLVNYSSAGLLEQLDQAMSADEQRALSGLMSIDPAIWPQVVEGLSDEGLLHLIRFFAVAENLPGWEAQEKSPVIPLAKALRKRGARLDRAFLSWLREVNNNRFLPYGPL